MLNYIYFPNLPRIPFEGWPGGPGEVKWGESFGNTITGSYSNAWCADQRGK